MICFPNAKINIGLNIIEKRADGFHNIESVMYPLKGILFDALEIIHLTPSLSQKVGETTTEKRENTVNLITSGIEIPGDKNENLCIKAYNLIKKDYPQIPSIEIYLLKTIPIGAGLGGGSADAAFFIRLLNEKFELGISWGETHHYARQLGSDCSFFVSNNPAFADGKGDQLESIKLDLSSYYVLLIYPNIHINTATAYSGVIPKKPKRSLEHDIQHLPIQQWKKYIHNDFEDSIFLQYPELGKIKEKLYSLGAVYSSLSGSGSTMYGIFKQEPKVKNKFGEFLVWKGKMN
jgi:4-diphosphocytidyl-2-C-methyl-D-erythritol kinase